MIKHFTVTTHIVHKSKVLLHLHKTLNIWIPVGGHVDENELPQDTAIREAKEEAGLDIKLYNPDIDFKYDELTEKLVRPMHLHLHHIKEDHKHMNFAYFATADTFDLSPKDGETKNLKWFSEEELVNVDLCEGEKVLTKEVLKLLG